MGITTPHLAAGAAAASALVLAVAEGADLIHDNVENIIAGGIFGAMVVAWRLLSNTQKDAVTVYRTATEDAASTLKAERDQWARERAALLAEWSLERAGLRAEIETLRNYLMPPPGPG